MSDTKYEVCDSSRKNVAMTALEETHCKLTQDN